MLGKEKNMAREVKGSAEAAFRADLKSNVSQATKQAGEFQIRKRGSDVLVGDENEKTAATACRRSSDTEATK